MATKLLNDHENFLNLKKIIIICIQTENLYLLKLSHLLMIQCNIIFLRIMNAIGYKSVISLLLKD